MQQKFTFDLERETPLQYLIAFICLFVYAGCFFFPLVDKDAAHHANIALYMYEHDNFINLVDRGKDYLDKPHLLFWSSLLSFEIFGVNSFAHRLPAFLFSLFALYSTFKLCRHLSDKTTAKLATLLLATSQAFILAIPDARMEAPLTAFIIFGLWQMILYIDEEKWIQIILAALGTALAFSTKGWLGPVIIFISSFFYLLVYRKWSVLASFRTWIFIPLFFLFISPVLYAYYVQFDLHPEKIIRGKSNRSGLHFILWDQLFERSQGFDQGHKGRNSSYFFLYHTFLWAFFPWSILGYAALFYWLKKIFVRKEYRAPFNFLVLSFAFILFAISFSKFKMPHYIIMLLPMAAIFTAPYLLRVVVSEKLLKIFYPIQLFLVLAVLVAIILLNYYFFLPASWLVWVLGTGAILFLIYLCFKKIDGKGMKLILLSAVLSLVLNFFLFYSFFPNVMPYQAGNTMVEKMKTENIKIPDDQIMLLEMHAHSFDFYRKHNHNVIEPDSLIKNFERDSSRYFLMTRIYITYFEKRGFSVNPLIAQPDYNVSTMKLKFLNPATRDQNYDTLFLARISKQ